MRSLYRLPKKKMLALNSPWNLTAAFDARPLGSAEKKIPWEGEFSLRSDP